jgi:predicted PurR-regulated permease PerM
MNKPRPHWSSRTKLVVILLLLLVGVYLLYRFSVLLTPMVLAVILAYVLSPLVNFFQRRLRLRRGLGILLAYLVMIAVLTALPMVLVPPLAAQSTQFNMDIQRFLRAVETLLAHQYNIAGQVINVDAIFQQAIGSLQGVLEPVFGQTLGFVIDVLTSLIWVVFILVISFYLIKDWLLLRAWLEDLTPPAYRDDFQRLREEIHFIWGSFFRGQLVLASVVATIFTIAGFILGLPFALTMGVLAGLLEFLPSVGHGIWLIIASLLALFAGSTWLPLPNWIFMLMIIGLHLVYQQFDLNYLIPRIIGRSVHLHPAVVILGIVAGAVFAGVLGVLLAAPTIASLRVLARYVYANLFDVDPFQAPIAPPLPPPNPQWWRKAVASRANRTEN